jgi:transcriptional regulator with XRE-family HTH domain
MTELPERWLDLGEFIRQQRETARISIRHFSKLTGISNPYLSQIERGLRKPSAEILQQIARGLHLSAETLYVRAGILERAGQEASLVDQIYADPHLDPYQREALARIYLSFLRENGHDPAHAWPQASPEAPATDGGGSDPGAGGALAGYR